MSTAQLGTLNVEILRNLGIVAEDESALNINEEKHFININWEYVHNRLIEQDLA